MASGGIEVDSALFGCQSDWRDANSAMIELEKGLRSSNTGEQCEAIVRFPKLFEKFPFPILVNSAFMKLTDVFYSGSNFLRLCILQVTKESRKHLGKILSVDDCVRRLCLVMISNDPIARAITLRVFGNIASIISEHKNIHHSVQQSLNSRDHVELEAAIFASYRLSAESAAFASAVCGRIADMIQGLGTPTELKLKLIHILRYMHHDEDSIFKARQLCQMLLLSYPASNFVKVTLHTLSLLSVESLLDVNEQINLLLTYLADDPRLGIRKVAIQDLKLFASKVPHIWNKQAIHGLAEVLVTYPQQRIQVLILQTLTILSHSMAVNCIVECKDILISVFERFGLHTNLTCAALTLDLCSSVAVSDSFEPAYGKDAALAFYQQLDIGMETLLINYATSKITSKEVVKSCFHCISDIITTYPHAKDSLIQLISVLVPNAKVSTALMLCKILQTIEASNQLLDSIKVVIQKLTDLLKNNPESNQYRNLIVTIIKLLSHAIGCMGNGTKHDVSDMVTSLVDVLKKKSDDWGIFCIARCSARVGFYSIASPLFKELTTKVSSENYYFYLTALHHFCQAEANVSSPRFENDRSKDLSSYLMDACNDYHKGLTALKASVTPKHSLTFQCKFAKLRADFLQSCMMLNTFSSAINSTVLSTPSVNVMALPQWTSCAQSFRKISESLELLYSQSFDADSSSLNTLKTFQQSCLLIAHSIELLMTAGTRTSTSEALHDATVFSLDEITSLNSSKIHNEIAGKVFEFSKNCQGISYVHTYGVCLKTVLQALLRIPFNYPLYYFAGQQTTKITLAISPNARNPSEPIVVILPTQLILKVEGIIQHGRKQGIHRQLKSISLTLKASAKDPAGDCQSYFKAATDITLRQIVEPRNDYFSAQFLLNLSLPSLYNVNVDVSVIDSNSISWHTGPQMDIPVRCSTTTSSNSFGFIGGHAGVAKV